MHINFDQQEEQIVDNLIDDWKLVKLQKEYKLLFYKSKEIKCLLDNYAETNDKLYAYQRKLVDAFADLKLKYAQAKSKYRELKQNVEESEAARQERVEESAGLIRELEARNKELLQ